MQPNLSFTGRIASFSFRHKWYVLGVWLMLLVASGIASSGLSKVLTTQDRDLTNSDSVQAENLIKERFGARPTTEVLVVRSDTDTVDTPQYRDAVTGIATALRGTDGVAEVATYFDTDDPQSVSADKHATIVYVTFAGKQEDAEENAQGVLAAIANAPKPAGYTAHITGAATLNQEFAEIAEKDLAAAEMFGLPIALIVMVLAFGALVAAGVPLLLGIAAIAPALGSVALIGNIFELSFFVSNVITMIGLAVGIDYSLFIIGRYREELAHGHSPYEAMGIAADTSGRAVFFSGLTVLMALSGMTLVRNTIFLSIGIGAMVVTLYAILASLTLLPAVLGLLGRKVNALRLPFLGKAGYGTRFWGAITSKVQQHPVVFVVASAGLLVAAALPLTTISLGASGVETLPKDTTGYQAITALQRDFPGGLSDPLLVVVDGDQTNPATQRGIANLKTAVEQHGGLQWLGVQTDAANRTAVIRIASMYADTGDAAQNLVHELRGTTIPRAFSGSTAKVHLGSNLAEFVDYKTENDAKIPVVFGFVLGLSFILLLLVFRSVAIPFKAILMNLLSVGAAYGLIVLVFQHGFLAKQLGFVQVEQIEFWLPLFLFSILFGLSMDYHVFLLSRVKEEYERTGNNKLAVATGVRSTAGMITSAAVIMVAVFAAFASGRIAGIQQMGFGLAVAVFLDATVVRSVLVPASMQLLGRYNWWFPSWLEWLPRLNVEGTAHHAAPAPAAGD